MINSHMKPKLKEIVSKSGSNLPIKTASTIKSPNVYLYIYQSSEIEGAWVL
jgi:hypothetical protein